MKTFGVSQSYEDVYVDEINLLLQMENRIKEVESEISVMNSK